MDKKLEFVVGQADAGQPAVIRLFGPICRETAQQFNDEFLWLHECVKPSKIVVLINSEGGSVLHGMSIFSVIQSSTIEVDCIIEGLAASMASVIWSAGKNIYMHDYSILMIHNPFLASESDLTVDEKNMVNAYRTQLETIYCKRFGLTKDKVKAIMDGEEGADGTYFNAKEAVNAGILPKQNVLKTSQRFIDKVKNECETLWKESSNKSHGAVAACMREVMNSAINELGENKLLEQVNAIAKKEEQHKLETQKAMEEKFSFEAVSAQLGIDNSKGIAAVTARIAELMKKEQLLGDTEAQLNDARIKLTGKEAEVSNLQGELKNVKAELEVYKNAEKAAKQAQIEAMVDEAVKCGKIQAESKGTWINMANTNFELAKATLGSIPARDKISAEIGSDVENKEKIEETLKTVEEKNQEQVNAIVKDFEFKKF